MDNQQFKLSDILLAFCLWIISASFILFSASWYLLSSVNIRYFPVKSELLPLLNVSGLATICMITLLFVYHKIRPVLLSGYSIVLLMYTVLFLQRDCPQIITLFRAWRNSFYLLFVIHLVLFSIIKIFRKTLKKNPLEARDVKHLFIMLILVTFSYAIVSLFP